jgi:hypothetical protein
MIIEYQTCCRDLHKLSIDLLLLGKKMGCFDATVGMYINLLANGCPRLEYNMLVKYINPYNWVYIVSTVSIAIFVEAATVCYLPLHPYIAGVTGKHFTSML